MINQENLKAAFDPDQHISSILNTAEVWYDCEWWQFRRKRQLLCELRQEISLYRTIFGHNLSLKNGTKK